MTSARMRHLTWALIAAWTGAGIVSILAFRGAVAIGSMQVRGEMSFFSLLRTQSAPWIGLSLLTPWLVAFAHRHPVVAASWPTRVRWHLPGLVIFAAAHITLHVVLLALLHGSWPAASMFSAGSRLMSNAVLIVIEYVVIIGAVEVTRWRTAAIEREREAVALSQQALILERHLADAQVQVLRQQLQPHFLFNALNAVTALIDESPMQAKLVVGRLADLLRLSLSRGQRHETTLADELDCTDRYLDVERARFGDRLTVTYDVSDEALRAAVPVFILQPLVENAIKHGVARCSTPAPITVGGARRASELHVWVRNTAPAAGPAGDGHGLTLTRARVHAQYGAAATVSLARITASEVEARITVPYRLYGQSTEASR